MVNLVGKFKKSQMKVKTKNRRNYILNLPGSPKKRVLTRQRWLLKW